MGALASGFSAFSSDNNNAETARMNASLARLNASDSLNRGAIKAGTIQTKGSQLVGEQKAAYSASGIDATAGGTPMQAMADTRMMAAHDAQTAVNNAAREAWGYKAQAYGYTKQAQNDADAGLWALTSGIVSTEGQMASAAGGGG